MILAFFPIVIAVIVLVIFGIVLFRGISQWNRNNNSPRLTVSVTVVAKRTHVRHYDDGSVTHYYATFQFESGDRLELHVPSSQFGYLVEGDRGNLTFQGTRFLGFERT